MMKLICGAAIAALTAGAASAQDPNAPSTYGSQSMSAGFSPDPYVVDITSGGVLNARSLPGDCRGWIANAPDFDFTYQAGGLFELTIAAVSDSDTTLVINGPDGRWYCDDDGGEGLNPLYTFANPMSGRYDVWIGSYNEGEYADAALSFSEVGATAAGYGGAGGSGGGMGSGPDWSAEPTFGSVSLSAGFTPDPYRIDIISGGGYDASQWVDSSCRGWIAGAPDFDLYYTAGVFDLTISANSSTDTTLVINMPDGSWICDDDSGDGLNPLATIRNPQSGLYDIWIGSFTEGNSASAEIAISEIGRQ